MTVALGLACSDGALLATDSMGMNGRLANSVTKIHPFAQLPLVWTFAGSTYVAQEIGERIQDVETRWAEEIPDWAATDPVAVKHLIERDIRPLILEAHQSLAAPPGAEPIDHGIDLMFASWTPTAGGFLIRLHPDLAVMINTDPMFCMGYGQEYATVAHGLLSHHLGDRSSLHEGQLLAHRTISAVCDMSSGGVGLPVQVALVDQNGAKVLGEDDVEAVSVAVDRWKTLERETLLGFLAGRSVLPEVAQDLPEAAE